MTTEALVTIFARATGSGRAGVAIIRISGERVNAVIAAFGRGAPCPARTAILHKFQYDGEFIDSGLVLYFPAPHSFTGEDVVEFHLHGGTAIVDKVMTILASLEGIRLAHPGEFSQRAFLNQKMDLVEAEGLVDMINAQTAVQHRIATRLMQGHASEFFENLRNEVISAMALMEAYIDFPDEEIPPEVAQQVTGSLNNLKDSIEAQCRSDISIERLQEGFVVTLIGKPNSGKSSLLNALVKRDAAIVSNQEGTTRDVLQVNCEINGLPVTLVDTAGLRETEDEIEKIGVRKALENADLADVILQLVDSREESVEPFSDNVIVVATKNDLNPSPVFAHDHAISVVSTEGVSELLQKIAEVCEAQMPEADCFALHQRHRDCLMQALSAMGDFDINQEPEIGAEYLRQAAEALTDIIGTHSVDDLLDIIFSSFCIGK